jgi:cytochrome c-type biogenesis protein CcmE
VKRRARLLVAAAMTVAAMTMVLIGTFQSSVPFVGPGDLGPEFDGRRVQVEGLVDRVTPRRDHLVLELSDGDAATVTVRYTYTDQRPLTLEVGRIVVAKGLYRKGVVDAHQVSVRAHSE